MMNDLAKKSFDQEQQPSSKRLKLNPPNYVSGLKELDRSKFEKKIQVTCLRVQTKDLKSVLKIVKQFLLKKPNFSPIVKLDGNESLVYLNPDKVEELKKTEKFNRLVKDYSINLEDKEVTLNYENFNSNEILDSILSKDNLSLSSFSLIGHIIHLNLKSEYEPYKKIIGQVLLDKHPSQSLVLNKLDKIDSVYRNFNFDILAKKDESINTIVQVNEYGFKFKMDFSKVYWNPRLSTEHERIVQLLNKGDVVYDVFAGIGPFAIPAAKKKDCKVFANDLNPESFNYLNENIKLNKVQSLKAFNLDGREFIRKIVKKDLVDNWIKLDKSSDADLNTLSVNRLRRFHVIMNLPAIAIEFLDAFVGLTVDILNDPIISKLYEDNKLITPIVYCYCFHQTDQDKNEIIKRVKDVLNYENIEEINLFFIRKVAPSKEMYRITFKLPVEVLFAEKFNKRIKIE